MAGMGFILFCATLSLWGQGVHSHQINPAENDSYHNPISFISGNSPLLHGAQEWGTPVWFSRAHEVQTGQVPPPSAAHHHPKGSSSPKVFPPFRAHPSSTEHIPGFRGHPKSDQVWWWNCQHLLLQQVCLAVLKFSFSLVTWKSEFPIRDVNWASCLF